MYSDEEVKVLRYALTEYILKTMNQANKDIARKIYLKLTPKECVHEWEWIVDHSVEKCRKCGMSQT